jgi:hypothetical protein
MSKKIVFIIALTYFYTKCFGQDITPYQTSAKIELDFNSDTTKNRFRNAALKYCLIGNYLNAKLKLEADNNEPYTTLSNADSTILRQQSFYQAKSIIIKQAKEKQILIINENNTEPKHRIFTESLLQEMYNNGYHYLVLEALDYKDKYLNSRKFPTTKTGKLALQPQMGNLIRTALRIGFKIIAYHSKPNKSEIENEIQQVKNISEIFKKDPTAKVIIHCGKNDIYENSNEKNEKSLAERIKETIKIDPLTINQVRYTEKSKRDLSDPILQKIIIMEPSVMISDITSNIFTTIDNSKQWDITVFHPFSIYVNGRPSWINFAGNKISKEIPKKPSELNYPYLVLAYLESELKQKEAIPVDVVEIQNENDKKLLTLYSGEYKIFMTDNSGKTITQMLSVNYQ